MTIPRLYAIADGEHQGLEHLVAAVATMADAGIGWIQLRLKRATDLQRLEIATACVRRLEGSATRLWIDDRVDLAALLALAGVHVGQDDLPPAAARQVVGPDVWIGRSTHTLDQLAAADADPAVDVVAIGPIFATTSKERPAAVVGLENLRRWRSSTAKRLVAIGGIDAERLRPTLDAGADAVALIGALGRGSELARNCRHLLALAA